MIGSNFGHETVAENGLSLDPSCATCIKDVSANHILRQMLPLEDKPQACGQDPTIKRSETKGPAKKTPTPSILCIYLF